MTWVRLDDGFADHPKTIGLSDRAFRLHVRALCYCSRHLTDGAVPKGFGDVRVVRDLVAVGLWDETEQGYFVHDYLEYNYSRADIEGSREQAAERMRAVRTNNDGSSDNPIPIPQKQKLESKALARFFEEFWRTYPRKVGKRTAELAWSRAVLRCDPELIVEAAERYAADPNLPEDRFVPHPTTWLNRDGWEDGPCPPRSGGSARSVGNILALADRMEDK